MIDIAGKISGKTVVVTGGSGYIGSALTEELSKYNLRVIRTGRKKIAPKSNVEDWVLDLNDSDSWYKIVSEVDIIFHLAGNTSVYDAEENPEDSLTSTLFPIIKLINASRKLNRIPRIVFASTATIYGLTSIFPVSELTRINPITTYDLHKLFSENELAMATENKIISAISLRLANVYGASTEKSSAKDRGVLNKVTKAALRGHDLTVYGDGKCVRDYIYIDDVIDW